METATSLLLVALAAALTGAAAAWLALRRRRPPVVAEQAVREELAVVAERLRGRDAQLAELRSTLSAVERERTELHAELRLAEARGAELEAAVAGERRASEEKLALLRSSEAQLRSAFDALSAEALRRNSEAFLALARGQLESIATTTRGELDARREAVGALVSPLREAVERVATHLRQAEQARAEAHGSLTRHLAGLAETQARLQGETANLVRALRTPGVRGRWGEVQLRRVVELAGMLEHCDFREQPSLAGEDGRRRPDLIVTLPGGRTLVVDAKAPLAAYLEALEARDDAERRRHLEAHARQVRQHLGELAGKAYWESLPGTPELVVLFLPGEALFSAALEHDPGLIEAGAERRVVLATPTTLIALLKAVAHGWREQRIAANAQEISELGRQLFERLRTFAGHLDELRRGLERAVLGYNEAVGSFEARIMVSARRFRDLGAASGEEIEPLPALARGLRAGPAEVIGAGEDEPAAAAQPPPGDRG